MGVNAQRDTFAETGQPIVSAERNKDFLSDPVHVKDQIGRRLEGQSACQ
jgi:hypothetical protein